MTIHCRLSLTCLMTATVLVMVDGAAAAPLPGGASSLVETYEDWTVVCQMQQAAPACVVRQVQTNNQTKQAVLTVEVARTEGDEMRGALVLPLGLDLSQGAQLKLDDVAFGKPLPFSTCVPAGCVVSLTFKSEVVSALKAGKALSIGVTPANATSPVAFSISLKGISNALSRIAELAN